MFNLRRIGWRAAAVMIILGSAAVAYHLLGIFGVAVSGADQAGDLHAAWFPLRALVAISAARFCTGWVFAIREKITLPRKGEGI